MKNDKKSLIIMGTHWKGLRDFDWKRTDCDFWMFNEAPNVKVQGKSLYPTPSAIFQLHHEAIWRNPKNRSDEKHYEWLSSGNTPLLYMQKHYPDVPKSEEYPLNEILDLTKNVKIIIEGQEKIFKYFSSSPEYALALAAQMHKEGNGYKRVEVWGIELEHESEYVFQRVGFAFWCGYLAGLGVELILANSIFDAPIYGYEGDIAISSEYLKKRIEDLTKELGSDKDKYNLEAKVFLDSLLDLSNADTSKKIEQELNDLLKRNERAGILNGQIKEAQGYLEKALAMEEVTGTSVFSLGEFDSMRHLRNNEYSNTRNETSVLNTNISLYLRRVLMLKKRSHKREKAVNEVGSLITQMMNKNMQLLHLIGAVRENQFFIDSGKLSIKSIKNGGLSKD